MELDRVERRFDEVLEDEPDAVVLLFGHNISFRFELDEVKLRLQAMRAHSCILSRRSPEPPASTPSLEERLAALEIFLRRAASATRAKGIPLVIATMPSNLRLPLGVARADQYDPRFLEAKFLAARGRHDEAIRRLEALLEARDQPSWHYQLGEELARAGDAHRDYGELHRAVDTDPQGMRAPARLNDLLRRVAAQEGLLLRDTERAVESRAPDGLPGWETFIDNCHMLPEAIHREVDVLLALLREASVGLPPVCDATTDRRIRKGLSDVLIGVFNLAATAPPDLAQRWYMALSLAVESWLGRDPAGAERDVAAFLASSTFTSRGKEQATDLLIAAAEGYYRDGRRNRAFALNEQARDAGSAEAWIQSGLFHLRQDETEEARKAFERALALDDSREDARSFLGFLSPASSPDDARPIPDRPY